MFAVCTMSTSTGHAKYLQSLIRFPHTRVCSAYHRHFVSSQARVTLDTPWLAVDNSMCRCADVNTNRMLTSWLEAWTQHCAAKLLPMCEASVISDIPRLPGCDHHAWLVLLINSHDLEGAPLGGWLEWGKTDTSSDCHCVMHMCNIYEVRGGAAFVVVAEEGVQGMLLCSPAMREHSWQHVL